MDGLGCGGKAGRMTTGRTAVSSKLSVHLIQARKQTYTLHARARAYPVWTHNERVFGLIRESARGRLLVLGNFSEWGQAVSRAG